MRPTMLHVFHSTSHTRRLPSSHAHVLLFPDMLISKKNRVAIYSYLLREGVAVAPKDWVKGNHDEVPVPNLQFCKTMQSLVSRGYVRETFSWYVPCAHPRVLRFARGQTGSHAPAPTRSLRLEKSCVVGCISIRQRFNGQEKGSPRVASTVYRTHRCRAPCCRALRN